MPLIKMSRVTFFFFFCRLLARTPAASLDETYLVVVRGPIHQEFSLKCVNEESSTERGSHNRQVNRPPQLECQDLSQY